jgi:hypothetical protein
MTDLLQKLAKIFFIAGVVCLLVALHWLCFCLFTGSLNVAVFTGSLNVAVFTGSLNVAVFTGSLNVAVFTGSLNVAVFELAAFGVLLVFNAVLFSLLDDFL